MNNIQTLDSEEKQIEKEEGKEESKIVEEERPAAFIDLVGRNLGAAHVSVSDNSSRKSSRIVTNSMRKNSQMNSTSTNTIMGVILEEGEELDQEDIAEKEIMKQLMTSRYTNKLSDSMVVSHGRRLSGNFGGEAGKELTQSLLSDNSTNAPFELRQSIVKTAGAASAQDPSKDSINKLLRASRADTDGAASDD